MNPPMTLEAFLEELELDNSEFSDWGTGKSGMVRLSEAVAKLRGLLDSNSCATRKGSHNLVEVLRTKAECDAETVVRWCSRCGAVVIDLDVDNRTVPGGVSLMRHAELSKVTHNLLAEA